jgi:hypothetical protein
MSAPSGETNDISCPYGINRSNAQGQIPGASAAVHRLQAQVLPTSELIMNFMLSGGWSVKGAGAPSVHGGSSRNGKK